MRKFKAVDAVCIMVLAGIVGFFIEEEWTEKKRERKGSVNEKED